MINKQHKYTTVIVGVQHCCAPAWQGLHGEWVSTAPGESRGPAAFSMRGGISALKKNTRGWRPAPHQLQQSLLDLFLATDAVLGPRHGFQPLLLHLFLAVRAHTVFVDLD